MIAALRERGLWPARSGERASAPVKRYIVRDADGTHVATHVREDRANGKRLWWQQPDGTRGLGGLRTADLPLYGAERLAEAPPDAVVVVVEGERAADALRELGVLALGTVTGASGTPSDDVLRGLVGRDAVLWADHDDVGRDHMARVAARLRALGVRPRTLAWPGAHQEGDDAADYVERGGTRAELEAMLAAASEAAREWLGAAQEHAQASDWPALQPLPTELPPVPSMSRELLPSPFRAWLEDAADRLQVPLEMVATPALVAFASVIGRRLGILPKLHDDWLVVPNLWGMTVARPGFLKSPAMREAVRPISHLAHEAADEHRARKFLKDAERGVIETAIAKLKRAAASKTGDPESMQEALQELLQRLDAAVATERRYVTSDATVEKLGELLNQNPAGILLLRDELSGWLRTLERPGREGDREFYIEGWNGTGRFDVDRIGRGTLHIEAVTVSIFGTIQPGKLRRYIADGTSADDGMLQRFQLVAWPDFSGEWIDVDRWPARGPRDAALEVFRAACTLNPEWFGASSEDSEIPALRFDGDAQALFRDWRGQLERRLRSEELAACPAFESHIAKYRKLMPALALVIHVAEALVPYSSVPSVRTVGLSAAKRAAALVDFYEKHARRLYAAELASGRPARSLAAKIESNGVRDGDPVRSVRRRDLAGLTTQDDLEAALAELTSLGWLRTELRHTRTKPERVIRLHPALLEGGHHG